MLEQRLDCPVKVVRAIDLRGWGVIRGQGTELMLTLGARMEAALFRDGVLVPNVTLGKHRLDPARCDLDGTAAWMSRFWKTVTGLRKRFKYDHLYLAGPYAGRMGTVPLPSDVTIIASLTGLLGGMAIWENRDLC